MLHSPGQILLSFGVADYSIPLTLLYWLEASLFGLSETGMRWPMLVCGIATVILLPLYAWRALGPRHAVPFAFLLAISPALVLYSRIARPYAVTLLLVYAAHHAFDRYFETSRHRSAFGALYALCAILATWMHLIAGPAVVAPFLFQAWSLYRDAPGRRGARIRLLLPLGVLTAAGMALAVLPPLAGDVSAISGKSGADSPSADTIAGVWYWWIGTGSTAIVVASLLLAAMGVPELWRRLAVARTVALGLVLTLAVVLLMRPAWVQNPMTFGRYLLSVIPLLLLAIATGAVRLADLARRAPSVIARSGAALILALPAATLAAQSPLRDIFFHPNSNIADPYFFFDFRPGHNPFPEAFNRLVPLSAYWSQLQSLPRGSLRIAAAPFHFESFGWHAPRWEQIGGQTIVPAWLTGFCIDSRSGEPARDRRFRFRNGVFVADKDDLALKNIDRIAFEKPYVVKLDSGKIVHSGEATRQCEGALRERFGAPEYEDDKLVVFTLAGKRTAHP
ncbi:MAG: glycosyltransferase family 39 protein [Betaproteobacteria bacterium]